MFMGYLGLWYKNKLQNRKYSTLKPNLEGSNVGKLAAAQANAVFFYR